LLIGKVQLAGAAKGNATDQKDMAATFCNSGKTIYAGSADAEHLQSNVIWTTPLFSEVDKKATCGVWGLRSKRLFDLPRLHLAPQSVGADHQDIAFMEQQRFWGSVDFKLIIGDSQG
jgi:hypothetical protein